MVSPCLLVEVGCDELQPNVHLNIKPMTMSRTVSCAVKIFMMHTSAWKDFSIGIYFQDNYIDHNNSKREA
jgi:hypothetical protein